MTEVCDAVAKLSKLGRLQVTILIVNVVASIAVVAVLSKFEIMQAIIGAEFVVCSIVGILITVAVENEHAFWALLFLQVQLGAFVTASAFIGGLKAQPIQFRVLVIAANWILLLSFLLLQRAVRKTWGWHAYHVIGGNKRYVHVYESYQRLTAALMLDAFHCVFFASAEEVLSHDILQDIVVGATAATTLGACRFVQLLYRREHLAGVILMSLIYVAGLCTYLFFAVTRTIDVVRNVQLVEWRGKTLSTGHLSLLLGIEWCTVLVRAITLAAIFFGVRIFGKGFAHFFHPALTQSGSRYLINPEEHLSRTDLSAPNSTHESFRSLSQTDLNERGSRVIPVRIVDATKRVYGTVESRGT